MSTQRRLLVAGVALVAMMVPLAARAAPPAAEPGEPELLATLNGGAGSGSAIGPGGALYVPQPAAGEIWRVDPESGETDSCMRAGCRRSSRRSRSAA